MENNNFKSIPQEKFAFVNDGSRLTDTKFDDKPIGFFMDAFIRFRKNKASVVAFIIIVLIILFSFLTPLLNTRYDYTFMDPFYAKKGPKNNFLSQFGIATGTTSREFSEKGLMKAMAIAMGAADVNSDGNVTMLESLSSKYSPIRDVSFNLAYTTVDQKNQPKNVYVQNIDSYLEVGFLYRSIEQSEYQKIVDFEKETGIKVLYPLIDINSGYCPDPLDANLWYKANSKQAPCTLNKSGKLKEITFSEDMKFEDNYLRDEDGNIIDHQYTGGGDVNTAQFKIRVLYYNYYIYKNGFPPEYIFGTDAQGYDLALRMAKGIKLSLALAVIVSTINFVLGAIYGAIAGYYGGITDLVMERITDILSGIPFIVVVTLFQLHLAAKVGPIGCFIFAYVVTGWIGMSGLVRTQFYRFKNQEYVMAARTLGAKDSRIIWKHIFPNGLGTIITACALTIPGVINSESSLSYLGIIKLGTTDQVSLGNLLADAQSIWTNYPHLMIFPAAVLSLLMICFNLFGNGLRDAFNPSLRGTEE